MFLSHNPSVVSIVSNVEAVIFQPHLMALNLKRDTHHLALKSSKHLAKTMISLLIP